jgi:hypothetical protein
MQMILVELTLVLGTLIFSDGFRIAHTRQAWYHRSQLSVDGLDSRGKVITHDADVSLKKAVPIFKVPFNISLDDPYGPRMIRINVAREELINLLDTEMKDPPDHFRLDYLVKFLESKYTPIQTSSFFNFATKGDWQLQYSNVLTPRASKLLKFSVNQSICPDGMSSSGCMENNIQWSLSDPGAEKSETGRYHGSFLVKCGYELTSRGDMYIQLREHILAPVGELPQDIEGLVMDLQRSIPFESFDPAESYHATTYMDTDLRVVRINGDRFRSIINIFTKKSR